MNRFQRHDKSRLHLWLSLLLLLANQAARAQVSMSVTPEFGPIYVPDAWTTLRVEITNKGSDSIQAILECPVSGVGGEIRFEQRVRLPERSRVIASFLVRLPEREAAADPSSLIAVVALRSDAGAEIARTNLIATAVTAGSSTPAYLQGRTPSLMLMLGTGHSASAGNEIAFSALLSDCATRPIVPVRVTGRQLPRHSAGYSACRALWISEANLDEIDQSQWDAMRRFVEGGGVLLVSSLSQHDPLFASPIADWIPVRVTGTREACELATGRVPRILFAEHDHTLMSEASATEGEVVLADAGFVHAAYREVGMGRVIFTSFNPAHADLKSPLINTAFHSLWPQAEQSAMDIAESLARVAPQQLPNLIGQRTLAWRWAMIWAGGFLAIAALSHLLLPNVRRPWAVGIVTLTGLSMASGLLIAGRTPTRPDDPARSAIITSIAVAPQSANQWDVCTFLSSPTDPLSLRSTSTTCRFYPIHVDPRKPAALQSAPFATSSVPVDSASLQSIWIAQGGLSSAPKLSAQYSFNATGLAVSISNGAAGPIRDALLIMDRRIFHLHDIPPGDSVVQCNRSRLNPASETVVPGTAISEESRCRAGVIDAMMKQDRAAIAQNSPPVLLGWLDPQDHPSLLTDTQSRRPVLSRRLSVICTSAMLTPSNGEIRLDETLCTIAVPTGTSLPYDFRTRQWTSTSELGSWDFAVTPPSALNGVRWRTMEIRTEVITPTQKVLLQRVGNEHNIQGAHSRENENLLEVSDAISARTVKWDITPEDLSADGSVRLRLRVEGTASSEQAQSRSQWQLKKFEFLLAGSTQSK